jgi:hypothetical protein
VSSGLIGECHPRTFLWLSAAEIHDARVCRGSGYRRIKFPSAAAGQCTSNGALTNWQANIWPAKKPSCAQGEHSSARGPGLYPKVRTRVPTLLLTINDFILADTGNLHTDTALPTGFRSVSGFCAGVCALQPIESRKQLPPTLTAGFPPWGVPASKTAVSFDARGDEQGIAADNQEFGPSLRTFFAAVGKDQSSNISRTPVSGRTMLRLERTLRNARGEHGSGTNRHRMVVRRRSTIVPSMRPRSSPGAHPQRHPFAGYSLGRPAQTLVRQKTIALILVNRFRLRCAACP